MSKLTSLTTTALAGACIALAVGCKKSDETKSEPANPTEGAATTPAKQTFPGVTDTEIKIGQSMPYSGPASAYGVLGKTAQGYFKMINDKGGVNGRKLTLISLDDSFAPPKAVENIRKLVESEGVAIIYNSVGTGTNAAVQKYLNEKKIPQLFVATGADRWADPKAFPFTMGWQPSYRSEATVYARYLLKEKPAAKLCVLYQNDDFGKDYLTGLKVGFGEQHDKLVIKTASYEPSDPTIDSQIVTLQAAGCDTLLSVTIAKFAAQAIRKVYDIGWKPLFILSQVAISRVAVLQPAGLDKSTGIVTAGYIKDITDPAMANDPGLNQYREFAKKYIPELDINDGNQVYAFGVAMTLVKVLEACGDDLSPENIMKQAASIDRLQIPIVNDGILITTGESDFRVYEEMQMARFNGTFFERFGEILSAQ